MRFDAEPQFEDQLLAGPGTVMNYAPKTVRTVVDKITTSHKLIATVSYEGEVMHFDLDGAADPIQKVRSACGIGN
jgi:hypothetical protein